MIHPSTLIFSTLIITGFLVSIALFLRIRKRAQVFSYNIIIAFFISFFVEMYGLVITFYIFGTYYSSEYGPARMFYVQNIGRYIGAVIIAIGLALIIVGWYQIYKGKEKLITTGLYRYSRHPQYLGLILFCLGFCIQYPLLISILIFPGVVILYYFLAQNEEKQLISKFGDEYLEYRKRTRIFI